MIGFKKIVGGTASSVDALGKHLLNNTLPAQEADISAYYHRGMKSGVDDVFAQVPVAVVRADMHPLVARGLEIELDRPLTGEEVNGLLAGRTASGEKIVGKHYGVPHERVTNPKTGERVLATPIGSYDFCPSPDKSVSVAWAFAPAAERAMIYEAHLEAAREAVAYIAERVGVAHTESSGNVQFVPGHVGWLEFTHFTARRTKGGFNEAGEFELRKDEVAGDPDLHTHHLIPNAVFCPDGRVGSLHTGMIEGFIFEADAFYQGRLADNLMNAGFKVELDLKTKAARMPIVPEAIRRAFSKRSLAGELIARDSAAKAGEDWDSLSPEVRIDRIRRAAHDYEQQRAKGGKDDVANFESWREQSARFGWTPPESFLSADATPELSDEQRRRLGYETALPMLAEVLENKSVITQWTIRDIAGRGLIPFGTKSLSDINAVTQLMREEGVIQDGHETALIWGHEEGKRFVSITTELHEEHEKEFVGIVQRLATDRSASIPEKLLHRTIENSGLRFEDDHGKVQLATITRHTDIGRYSLLIAAAGAGKTTALKPIIAAKKEMGWGVYATSLAWRQADDLVDAGVPENNVAALDVLLKGLDKGTHPLGPKDMLAIDEVSLLGTAPGLKLLRHAERFGFQIVALGDPKQCAEIGAGSVIGLTKKAIPEEIPTILTTIRQKTDREKAIVGLFREGRAKEALDMKREDGTAILVPGDYDKLLQHVAKLYMGRLQEKGVAPTVSAPTNLDAHRVSVEIRKARRDVGLVGEDLKIVKAGDNEGRQYGLAVAKGDKVRLFRSTNARMVQGGSKNIGRNGSVLEVLDATDDGLLAKSVRTGRVGFIGWETLTSKKGRSQGRVLLAYADCMTIHSAQGRTSAEDIMCLPAGSGSINGLQGYSGLTRHEYRSTIVTSDVAERVAVSKRRALNDPRPITVDDKWAEVARNLAYQPEKDLALSMLERVESVRRGTTRRFQAAMRMHEASGSKPREEAPPRPEQAQAPAQAPTQAPQALQPEPPPPAPTVQPAPQAAPAPVQQAAGQGALKPTAGWKLHLSIAETLQDPVTRDISDWLTDEGISHKIANSGGQAGKAMTIYVGSYAKARDLSDELHDRFRLPDAVDIQEDARWGRGVNARFDADGDPEFHQYGLGGVPILVRHVQDAYGTPDHGFNQKNAREAESILIGRYGAFYGPPQFQSPPQAAPEAPKPEAKSVQSSVQKPGQGTSPRPQPQERPQMSEAEIQAAFAAELDKIGLKLSGPPIMDGQKHTVQVEGAKAGRKSGWYRGFADGARKSVAGNSRTGEIIRWSPDRTAPRSRSPEEIAAQRAAAAADRQKRDERELQKELATALEAERIWKAAKPARPDHPYLVAKGITQPDTVRQAAKGETAGMTDKTVQVGGRLVVPMRDADGKMWNVQLISQNGSKVFLPGRKKGLFAVLGRETDPSLPLLFAEGYATGQTLHNTTALRTVVAFDSGNLLPVIQAVHAKRPDQPKIIAADNDHHLPGVSLNVEAGPDGKLPVSWPKGATGKAEGGNAVEYRVAGAADWKTAAIATHDTAVTIGNLLPGARYDVRVFSASNKRPLPNVGVSKAQEAAAAVGGKIAIPPFAAGDPGTDWNDYVQKAGAGVAAVELAKQGVPIVPPSVSTLPQQSPTPAQRQAHTPASNQQPKPEMRQ